MRRLYCSNLRISSVGSLVSVSLYGDVVGGDGGRSEGGSGSGGAVGGT